MESEIKPVYKQSTVLLFLGKQISTVEKVLNLASAGFILIVMFFSAGEVIGRYFFNYPIPGHLEIIELIMVPVVFLGMAYTQRIGGHIRMEILISKIKGKYYHMVEALTITLSLLIFTVITIYSFKFALDAYNLGDYTGYISWPTWPSKMIVPIGCFFLSIRFFIQIVQNIIQAVAGDKLQTLE